VIAVKSCTFVTLALVGLLLAVYAAGEEEPINVPRGKELMRKFQAGETLSPDDQGYLDRVRQEIRKRSMGKG
jgi:hypothetical protein